MSFDGNHKQAVFFSLPGHSFSATCCFEITWVKANQPDKIFCDTPGLIFFPKTAIL